MKGKRTSKHAGRRTDTAKWTSVMAKLDYQMKKEAADLKKFKSSAKAGAKAV